MRTTKITLDDGTYALVNHNSDWSGPAIVRWTEGDQPREATMPGVILQRLGYAAAHESIVRHLMSTLEQMPLEMPR
jgi:hypothetical protein